MIKSKPANHGPIYKLISKIESSGFENKYEFLNSFPEWTDLKQRIDDMENALTLALGAIRKKKS